MKTEPNDTYCPLVLETKMVNGIATPEYQSTGVTKREMFAAMAMQGLLAGKPLTNTSYGNYCDTAVDIANMLILSLNKSIEK